MFPVPLLNLDNFCTSNEFIVLVQTMNYKRRNFVKSCLELFFIHSIYGSVWYIKTVYCFMVSIRRYSILQYSRIL